MCHMQESWVNRYMYVCMSHGTHMKESWINRYMYVFMSHGTHMKESSVIRYMYVCMSHGTHMSHTAYARVLHAAYKPRVTHERVMFQTFTLSLQPGLKFSRLILISLFFLAANRLPVQQIGLWQAWYQVLFICAPDAHAQRDSLPHRCACLHIYICIYIHIYTIISHPDYLSAPLTLMRNEIRYLIGVCVYIYTYIYIYIYIPLFLTLIIYLRPWLLRATRLATPWVCVCTYTYIYTYKTASITTHHSSLTTHYSSFITYHS